MTSRIRVKVEERVSSWTFILVFLLGAIFAELTQDIISDFLFFRRASEGSFTPLESVVYWYYIPALVYISFFILALFLSMFRIIPAKFFNILLSLFAGIGFVLSLRVLGLNPIIVLLLLIPTLLLIFVLHYAISIKIGRRRVRV